MARRGGKAEQSPCTDLCDYSGPKGWCLGCGRTRQETRDWKALKPYGRTALLKELQRRMARIRAERPRDGSPDEP